MNQDIYPADKPMAPNSTRGLGRRVTGLLATLVTAVALTACGSTVELDKVPVENRSGTAVNPAGSGAQGSGQGAGGVAGVQVGSDSAMQPENLERVVYFDYDSFEVKSEYATTLDAHARFLKANAKRRVALEGHTDERGGREYNLALGQKRAEAVRRSLSLLGVGEAQMEPVSFGEEKPAVTGMNEAAFAKNRRVELTYR